MTLVLTFLGRDFVVQASDRRRVPISNNAGPASDDFNKAVLLRNVATLAFAGVADVGSIPIDEWLTEELGNNAGAGVQAALKGIVLRATEWFGSLARRGVPRDQLRHAFVAAGWGRFGGATEMRAYVCQISNAMDADGSWLATSRSQFDMRFALVPPDQPFAVAPTGEYLNGEEIGVLMQQLMRCVSRSGGPDSIAHILTHTIRQVADRLRAAGRSTVGHNVMIVSLPRVAALRPSSGLNPLLRGRLDRESVMTAYAAGDGNHFRSFAPNFVGDGFLMKGVYAEAAEPEHTAEEPPWFRGPVLLSHRVGSVTDPRGIRSPVSEDYAKLGHELVAELRRSVEQPTPVLIRVRGDEEQLNQVLVDDRYFPLIENDAALPASDAWLATLWSRLVELGLPADDVTRFLEARRGPTRGDVVFAVRDLFRALSDTRPR
jgi:hypothetical protein